MLRLASDEDVHGDLIRGLWRRRSDIDLVRDLDHLPEGTHDALVPAWTAAEIRVLISYDRNTMIDYVYRRIVAGELMPGLIAATKRQSIGSAINDILIIAECYTEEEMTQEGVIFLPL